MEEIETEVEFCATLVTHMINHGLTLWEVGLKGQPNLGRYKPASVVWTLRPEHRCSIYSKSVAYCMHTSALFGSNFCDIVQETTCNMYSVWSGEDGGWRTLRRKELHIHTRKKEQS